jgi:hypothetical protein
MCSKPLQRRKRKRRRKNKMKKKNQIPHKQETNAITLERQTP